MLTRAFEEPILSANAPLTPKFKPVVTNVPVVALTAAVPAQVPSHLSLTAAIDVLAASIVMLETSIVTSEAMSNCVMATLPASASVKALP